MIERTALLICPTVFADNEMLGGIPLTTLLDAKVYPNTPAEVQAFYAEAAIVVDFLTHTAERAKLLPKFVDAMIEQNDLAAALKLYGYTDQAEFEKAYGRYRKHF